MRVAGVPPSRDHRPNRVAEDHRENDRSNDYTCDHKTPPAIPVRCSAFVVFGRNALTV